MLNALRRNRRFQVVALSAAVALAAGIGAVVATAQTDGSDVATQALQTLTARGKDDAIVATVNGVPITRRQVDVGVAIAQQPNVGDSSGRPLGRDRSAILQQLIDDEILGQAAEAAGVTVTDDEVSMAIRAGITDPYNDPATTPAMRKLMDENFRAMGTTVDAASTDPAVRHAMRNFVLIQRFALKSGRSRADLLAAAKPSARVETFPDVLNAPR